MKRSLLPAASQWHSGRFKTLLHDIPFQGTTVPYMTRLCAGADHQSPDKGVQPLRQILVLKITAFGKGLRRIADGGKAGNRQHAKLADGIDQPRK